MPIDDPQVSRTLATDASGRDNNLDFFSHTHTDPPSIFDADPELPALSKAIKDQNYAWSADDMPRVDWWDANNCAKELAKLRNAHRTMQKARTKRGKVAAWGTYFTLPSDDYATNLTWLAANEERFCTLMEATQIMLSGTVYALNNGQPGEGSWCRLPKADAQRGRIYGKKHWIGAATHWVLDQRSRNSLTCSENNIRALIAAMASLAQPNGHFLTASNATIWRIAVAEHGCTLTSEESASKRVQHIRSILNKEGFLRHLRDGGKLRAIETYAAFVHHGTWQKRVGNTCDLNIPDWAMPRHNPDGPAWKHGLTERLAARDTRYFNGIRSRISHAIASVKNFLQTPYTVGYGLLFSSSLQRETHSAQARGKTEAQRKPIQCSQRARMIADDLTRTDPYRPSANGPYRHLVGQDKGRMSQTALARLIDAYVPEHIDTPQLLRAIAASQYQPDHGLYALGLKTVPTSPHAWFTTVLSRCDFSDTALQAAPAWHTVAERYSVHWCGTWHDWKPVMQHKHTAHTNHPPR